MVSQTSISVGHQMPCLGLCAYLGGTDAWTFPKSLLESILISELLRHVLNQPLFSDSKSLEGAGKQLTLDETFILTMAIL